MQVMVLTHSNFKDSTNLFLVVSLNLVHYLVQYFLIHDDSLTIK